MIVGKGVRFPYTGMTSGRAEDHPVLIFSNTGLPEQEFSAQLEKLRRVASYDSDTRSWYVHVPLTAPNGPPRYSPPRSRPPACTAPRSRCKPSPERRRDPLISGPRRSQRSEAALLPGAATGSGGSPGPLRDPDAAEDPWVTCGGGDTMSGLGGR